MGGLEYVPARGDIIFVDLDPVKGHEQAGKRPALVVSPQFYNDLAELCLIIPITTKIKKYPFERKLPLGLGINGAVLCDHIRSISYTKRNVRFVEKVGDDFMNDVIGVIKTLL